MGNAPIRSALRGWLLIVLFTVAPPLLSSSRLVTAQPPASEQIDEYAKHIRPLIVKYCFACHSTKDQKGDLDLERFTALEGIHKDLKPWPGVIEMLETGEMPPKKSPQPDTAERKRLAAWARAMLAAESRKRAGDPGRVVVRRLSNAEYDNTIRDLTCIDLHPARDFPVDGAAGEGFTNAGDALLISPTLLSKYLAAAKEIAGHIVPLPDGIRFSPATTKRDWTDEAIANLKTFYATPDGKLPIRPYLAATLRHRDSIMAGKTTIEAIAASEKLNAKYLDILWRTLTDIKPSFPLEQIRSRWKTASEKETDAILGDIIAWQKRLWTFVPIGSYRDGNTKRQVPITPSFWWAREFDIANEGFDAFRECFPMFICYSRIIPDDEVVSLKLYHREDGYLISLFLDSKGEAQLDRLWADLRHISEQPITEAAYLPQFIGYVSQDGGPKALAYYQSQLEPFREKGRKFAQRMDACIPAQIDSILDFASKAYRRPLSEKEQTELRALYSTLRKKGLSHDESLRTTITRVLVAPSFLFRIERSVAGKDDHFVSDWELATRLSYFLWATSPDDELRQLAKSGRLKHPDVLAQQVTRMLRDPKVRGLATEFGAQWLHVKDIQSNRQKNEKLFPTFDDTLRGAFFEESVRFFQDQFQNDLPTGNLLDADHTFLNETLAKHYGIAGITGPQWRRVAGVKKHGRGGILALGSVLTTQAGASRTSPVLRGNWVIEVLLGEKLPRPPADVPQLPESEATTTETVRQIVEKHTRIASCAVCHQRIDPIGFSLEKYDPIGRFRDKDLAGRPVDAAAQLKDGTKFEGLDGLRNYLLTTRKTDFDRHFCRKLLGYALGRSVTLSDESLLDEMMASLKANDQRISGLLQTIVKSKQFLYHRALDATKDE